MRKRWIRFVAGRSRRNLGESVGDRRAVIPSSRHQFAYEVPHLKNVDVVKRNSSQRLFKRVDLSQRRGIVARHRIRVKVNMSAHSHSPSTSKSAPPTVSSQGEVPSIPASSMPDSDVPQRTFPLFVIALAISATLPIGLGIGWTCRAKSAKPVTTFTHDDTSPNEETDSLSWAWRNLRNTDDLFRAGDFGLALQHYQSKECADPLRPSAELRLKIALCHEALGQWDEAVSILDSILEDAESELRDAALLAHSRIGLCRQDFEHTRATLRRLLGPLDELRPVARTIAEDACYLLASACLLEEDSAQEEPSHLNRPISPLHRSAMQWINTSLLDQSIPAQTNELAGSGEPNPTQPDAAPFDDETCTMATRLFAATSSAERRQLGEQLARQLLANHSKARWVGHLKMVLGEVAYRQGDLIQAKELFGEVADRSLSALAAIASYNQGVVQFQLREYRPASRTLGRFVDGAPGHELCPLALLLRGRSLLEFGDGEMAAFDLKRAVDSPGRDELRAWAAVYMGLAHLQSGKPMLAAQSMFHRRDRLQSDVARAELAFVVSLARLESLKPSDSRDREVIFMLRALASINADSEWLGACGRQMLGRAYQHLGLIEQAMAVYEHALRQDLQEPFASDIKLALADSALATGNSALARHHLADLQASQRAPWATQAGLRIAKWELDQGDHEKCLTICRELLPTTSDRAPIFRLMGRAHESTGHFDLAAECYAGLAKH